MFRFTAIASAAALALSISTAVTATEISEATEFSSTVQDVVSYNKYTAPTMKLKRPVIVNKRVIRTCKELIKVYRPAHMRGIKNVKVECVKPAKLNGAHGAIYSYPITPQHWTGGFTIKLIETTDIKALVDVYAHEGWHAVSYSWSKSKQARFLKQFGKNASWSDDKNYRDQPAERWAWAANSCYSVMGTQKDKRFDNRMPHGCKGVRYWIKAK